MMVKRIARNSAIIESRARSFPEATAPPVQKTPAMRPSPVILAVQNAARDPVEEPPSFDREIRPMHGRAEDDAVVLRDLARL